jgi:hypothetical protein
LSAPSTDHSIMNRRRRPCRSRPVIACSPQEEARAVSVISGSIIPQESALNKSKAVGKLTGVSGGCNLVAGIGSRSGKRSGFSELRAWTYVSKVVKYYGRQNKPLKRSPPQTEHPKPRRLPSTRDRPPHEWLAGIQADTPLDRLLYASISPEQ